MYALVFWLKTEDCSVVDANEIYTGKDGIVKANWGKKRYEAKVIMKSESKEFLESMSVTVDGNIIPPDRRSSVAPDLLLAKREHQVKEKEGRILKKKTANSENEALLNQTPIFELPSLSGRSSSISENEDDASKNIKCTVELSTEMTNTSNYYSDSQKQTSWLDSEDAGSRVDRNFCISNAGGNSDKIVETLGDQADSEDSIHGDLSSKNDKKAACFCSKLNITEKDVPNFNLLLKLVRSMHVSNDSPKASSDKSQNILIDIVELMPGSRVFVNRAQTKQYERNYYKYPRELVRRLMRMIMGKELKNHSATGKTWPPIPSNIYNAVFEFINDKDSKKKPKYKISTSEYRTVLTALCATERNREENEKKLTKTHKRKVNKDDKSDSNQNKNLENERCDNKEEINNEKSQPLKDQEVSKMKEKLIQEDMDDENDANHKNIEKDKNEPSKRTINSKEKMKQQIEKEYLAKLKELEEGAISEEDVTSPPKKICRVQKNKKTSRILRSNK